MTHLELMIELVPETMLDPVLELVAVAAGGWLLLAIAGAILVENDELD